MAAINNEVTALNILKAHFEEGLKGRLKDSLMEDALEKYRLSIEPIIDDEIRKITLGTINTWRDFASMKDQLNIKITINKKSA